MTAPVGLSEFSIALRAGTLLAEQYTIVGVLGRPGGFGITYLAEDIRLDTLVAIKEFLPRELATRAPDRSTIITHSGDHDSSFHRGLEQFLREARTLAKIHHPSVVRVRQFFEANGTAYLVMDYLEGQTLSEMLKETHGRLPATRAIEIVTSVLDGLRAAHALNIYHRDVKPANIYITAAGQPVLLDFGAARQATGTSGASMTAVLTPGFAPLEQYGHRGQGPWTDVYATSAVLYQMLTGVDPVPATDRVGDEPDPMLAPADIDPRIGQALSDAVMKGVAMSPRARPQTALEFQQLLREALAEHQRATTAHPVLPALPPVTRMVEPLPAPRLSFEDADRTPTPAAAAKPAQPKVVVAEAPRPASQLTPFLGRLGISRRVALGGGLSVVLMTLVVMVSLQGRGRDSTQSVVPADTSTVSVPRPVAAQPNADSLVASRAADSTHRADSIMVAAKKQRAADSIALAVRRQRTADSIRLAAARRSDSISRLAKSGPTKSGPATTTQSGRAVAQAPVDPPKTAASIPELRNPGSAYPTNNTTVNPVPPPTAPKPTFQAAAASELQRFADFFPAADRRAVQRALGAEETDRIWRKLDGHPQISAAAKIVDTNLRDSTATFFLVITDRASRADLVSGEYKASFNPIPGGLRLFTAAPTRR